MQNMKKLIAMMLMLLSVFVISCNKDDDDDKLSPAETKTALEALNTDMAGYLDELQDAEGIAAMEALMSLPDPFDNPTKSTEHSSALITMQNLLTPAYYTKTKLALSSELFPWDENKGYKYVYNGTYFNRISGTANQIIIEFPTEGNSPNDATITIYNYGEVAITNDGYTDYYPTALEADLVISSIEYVDIDFSASWNANEEPEALSINVYLNPFTFTGTFNNTGTTASADFEIDYEETLIFAAGVDATFETTNWDNPPLTIGGYVQLLNVKVVVDANFANIMDILEGETESTDFEALFAEVNAEFDAYITVDGTRAASIILVWDDSWTEPQPEMIVFEFTDGSTEPALPFFEDFAADLEDFFLFFDELFNGGM